jgi:spore coat protein U-like protein
MFTVKVNNILFASVTFLISAISYGTCTGTAPCTCSIAVSNMPFGNYQFTNVTPTDSQTTVTVTCTSGSLQSLSANYTISGNFGGNPSTARFMTGPLGSQLSYNLYTNMTRTTIWGDGTSGTAIINGSCSQDCPVIILCGPRSCNSSHTVYGRIPAAQTVAAGSYSQIIQVTVTF